MMKTKMLALALAAFGLAASAASAADVDDRITPEWRAPEHRQFDFWIGSWDVNLRTLQPDNSWKDSVKARAEVIPILDGKAILELWDSPTIKGFSLRTYDEARKKWVLFLNWPGDNNSSIGAMTGGFRHGRGEFIARGRRPDGSVSVSRYTFCDITPTSLRWDDAFSQDGGKTWTNNWIMEFSRRAPSSPTPLGPRGHTYESGGRCQGQEFDALNALASSWTGEVTLSRGAGELKAPAKLRVIKVLDGCSTLVFLDHPIGDRTYREFSLLTYNKARGTYLALSLDNQAGSKARLARGAMKDGVLTTLAGLQASEGGGREKGVWTWPEKGRGALSLERSASADGQSWRPLLRARFERDDLKLAAAINPRCPRSGGAIDADALTQYRGRVVGFCKPGCRDDFAENAEERPKDRAYFDAIIARESKAKKRRSW